MEIQEVLSKITKLCNCSCDGYLQTGRYYMTSKRYYAIMKPLQITYFETDSAPPIPDQPDCFPITINFDVDYHFMQENIDIVAQRLSAEFERLYKASIGQLA